MRNSYRKLINKLFSQSDSHRNTVYDSGTSSTAAGSTAGSKECAIADQSDGSKYLTGSHDPLGEPTRVEEEVGEQGKGTAPTGAPANTRDGGDGEGGDDKGAHGMFVLVDPPSQKNNVDIVAIHGLNGHYYKTWSAKIAPDERVNWLKDWLPTHIPNARIMSYGYNSSVQFSKSTAGISDFAEGLLVELMSWRNTEEEKSRPVMFVCHSLGGIVFKQALIRARERDHFTELLHKIRGVAFFGTPHAGSSLASFGEVLASVLKAASFGTHTNSKLVTDLKRNSETLWRIAMSFVDRSKALRIISFYETEKMDYSNAEVVPKDSAIMNLPNEVSVPVNANHRDICKFSRSQPDEKRFRVVWANLRDMAQELIRTEAYYSTGKPYLTLTKEEQQKCFRSFYQGNYQSFMDRNPDRVAGTCEWFLHHPQYLDWRKKGSSSLLWVSADPGCGKSVLAKFLVEHLRQTKSKEGRPELVCHFFFKDDSDEQRSAVLALRALLHQIFIHDKALLRHAFKAFEAKGQYIFDDFDSLWTILAELASDPEATNLLLILDALDECEVAQANLLKSLDKFYSQRNLSEKPFLKIILLSRPENIIKASFRQNLATIRLRGEDEADAINKDVERVVCRQIQDLGVQEMPADLLAVLRETLVEGADRTFLWTTLIIDLLKDAATEGATRNEYKKILENRSIDSVYEHLLAKSTNVGRSKQLLQVVLAAARPLTLDELNVALAVNMRQRSFKELEADLVHPAENHVKAVCGHFIRIIRNEVYLVHQTAREFLLRQQEPDSLAHDSAWSHSLTLEGCNDALHRSCVSYLFLKAVAEDKNVDSTWCFLDYAFEHWSKHYRDMDMDLGGTGHSLVDDIFSIGLEMSQLYYSGQFSLAHRLILHIDHWRYSNYDEAIDPLLDALIQRLLGDDRLDLNAVDDSGQTFLHCASAISSGRLVQMMLEHGASSSTTDRYGNTALHYALMDYPISDDEEDAFRYGTYRRHMHYNDSSHLAKNPKTSSRRQSVADNHGFAGYVIPKEDDSKVEALVRDETSLDWLGEDGKTPLHMAVERGQVKVVDLLCSHGADISVKSADLRTTLEFVARSDNREAVSAVLDKHHDLKYQELVVERPLQALRRRPTMEGAGSFLDSYAVRMAEVATAGGIDAVDDADDADRAQVQAGYWLGQYKG